MEQLAVKSGSLFGGALSLIKRAADLLHLVNARRVVSALADSINGLGVDARERGNALNVLVGKIGPKLLKGSHGPHY